MEVTNNAKGLQGIRVDGGRAVFLKPAETRDLKLFGKALERAKELPFLSLGKAGKTEKLAPAKLEARHRGGGSWSIMRGDEELVEKLSKEDAEAFNGMSDEDKAAYVEAAKK